MNLVFKVRATNSRNTIFAEKSLINLQISCRSILIIISVIGLFIESSTCLVYSVTFSINQSPRATSEGPLFRTFDFRNQSIAQKYHGSKQCTVSALANLGWRSRRPCSCEWRLLSVSKKMQLVARTRIKAKQMPVRVFVHNNIYNVAGARALLKAKPIKSK